MDNHKNIIWLASYPKSGNTWFRIFLANLLLDADKPVNINNLQNIPIASSRNLFDDATGIFSADLSPDEIDNLRPEVYSYLAKKNDHTLFYKIHDAYTLLTNGKPLIPSEATKGSVYIIRNPLDVAISFASHSGCSIDKMIEHMADNGYTFSDKKNKLNIQLRQKLLSWDLHIQSWVDMPDFPAHVMRYEDMKSDPIHTFTKAVEFIGLNKSSDQIKKAVAFSAFKEIQKQEKEEGFIERPVKAEYFFRKGESGSWREHLNKKQVKKIIDAHESIMTRFGYLTEKGDIVF